MVCDNEIFGMDVYIMFIYIKFTWNVDCRGCVSVIL